MPVFNAEVFIKETIDSVLSQTFEDFELLILDDGSTDQSVDIVKSYIDVRVHYIKCPHDYISTINKGIELAKGKYIARMDHDDLMMPERLKVQYDFMEKHPEIAACGGYMQAFGLDSRTIRVPLFHDDIILYMLIGNPISNPTGIIRKSILTDHNIRHQEGYSFADDFKLWSDIAKVGRLANIPKVLTKYRTSNRQASVVNYGDMMEAASIVQQEMVQYFLKSFKPVEELGSMVSTKMLPCVEQLYDSGFFSKGLYLKLMYELINGLMLRGNFSF